MSRKLINGAIPTRSPDAPKGGRVKDLTPEMMEKVLTVLRIGTPVDTAFALQGISYFTLRSWVLEAHEKPDSLCAELVKQVRKSIAEWEVRDLAAWDKHIVGAPAEYEQEVVRDADGKVIMKNGQPLMQVARDGEGRPIVRRPAIQPDWRAAVERLKRRRPRLWSDPEATGGEQVLTFDNTKPATQETSTFEERIARAVTQLEDDV